MERVAPQAGGHIFPELRMTKQTSRISRALDGPKEILLGGLVELTRHLSGIGHRA
jgi:hypothetical protein